MSVLVGRLIQYAAASVLVRVADEGARVALALLALRRTDSTAVGGMLIAVLLAPHVVAAPLVGVLADRARRPQLVVAAAAAGFGAALVGAAAGLGRLPLLVVVLVLLAGGCCGPALTGALSSQLPALLPEGRLPRAFGIDSLAYNGAGIAGPGLVALVAAVTSPAAATIVLGGAATLGAALIAVLPIPALSCAGPAAVGREDLLAGLKLLARDRILAAVTAATSFGQLGIGALPVIAALIASQHHHAADAGWLLTTLAGGGLLGSLAWTWRPSGPQHAPTIVMVGLAGVGLPLASAAFASSLPPMTASFAIAGFSNGPLFGALLATRNHRAPGHLRSQVFTLGAGAKITSTAAGAVLAGLLAGQLPVPGLLLVAGACPLLAAGLGQLSIRPTTLRRSRSPATQSIPSPPDTAPRQRRV